MDSNLSPLPGNDEIKAEFCKLSNDVANRKYRRHSPASGSSSSDESPKHERCSSPLILRGDSRKNSEHRRRKDDEKELDRDSGRTRYRSGDSYRSSDNHTCRNSHGYSRHDDYSRHDKHADNERRHYQASSHSGRDSRDYMRNADKYSRDRYDSSGHRSKDRDKDSFADRAGYDRKNISLTSEEKDRDQRRRDRDSNSRDGKRDCHKNFSDHKNDRARYHEESSGYRNEFSGRKDDSHYIRESYKNDPKDLDDRKEKKNDEKETNREKDFRSRAPQEQKEDASSEIHESMYKKPKLFTSDTDHSKDADGRDSSSSRQAGESDSRVTVGQVHANNSEAADDLIAAKVAALKAAELVNRNLVGPGFMSTEQKKKLLWGNKKSTTSEESGNCWDSSLFGDRERQEKFNKLMGVKGEVKVENKFDNQDAEKQKELQLDLEKQYTAGLRRRDGRTVGLGL